MYFMVVLIALKGATVTTISTPLVGITNITDCQTVGRAGVQTLIKANDSVEYLCIKVKE